MLKRFGIIGSGNVGITLSEYLQDINLLEWCYVHSDKSFIEAIKIIKKDNIIRNFDDLVSFPDYVIIAVNDSNIANIAKQIAEKQNELNGVLFSHCSGTLSADELNSLKKFGAITGATHPYQTFFYNRTEILTGISWGIDCKTEDENEFEKMINIFGGNPVFLSDKAKIQKELYHISAIVASNYLNTIISVSDELLNEIELDTEKFIKPIIKTTIENNLLSMQNSNKQIPLTGPIVRGDIQIISQHISALEKYPEIMQQYKLFGLATLEKAYSNNMIEKSKYLKIKKLLNRNNS